MSATYGCIPAVQWSHNSWAVMAALLSRSVGHTPLLQQLPALLSHAVGHAPLMQAPLMSALLSCGGDSNPLVHDNLNYAHSALLLDRRLWLSSLCQCLTCPLDSDQSALLSLFNRFLQ